MIVFEGAVRRLGVWLEGETLEQGLRSLDASPAMIEGQGRLEDIVLELADGEERRIPAATALRISGTLRETLELHAAVLVNGEVITGRVVSARAEGCGLRLEIFDSATRSQPPPPPDAADAVAAPVLDPDALSWAEAAAVSASAQKEPRPPPRPKAPVGKKKIRRIVDQKSTVPLPVKAPIPKASERRGNFVDQPLPEEGDFIHHRQFGVCEVKSIDDEGGLVVRTSEGRRRRLVLDIFDVLEARIEDDRLIYPLRPRKS